MASMMSIPRIATESVKPPKPPATAPRSMPSDNPTATATMPMTSE